MLTNADADEGAASGVSGPAPDDARREFLKRGAAFGLGAGALLAGVPADATSTAPEAAQPTAASAVAALPLAATVPLPWPATQVVAPPANLPVLAPLPMTHRGAGQIPRKPFGNTGIEVSCIGIGGATLGEARSYEIAERIVHEAIDAGIDFFDNAWEYTEHKSEDWMGRALAGRRNRVFLMTKVCTHGRDAQVAMQQLEDSLKRLRTDHLDLWQIHEVIHYNDPDLHFRPGGAVEALLKAKQQGKVRFTGFTGHKNPQIHLRMLHLANSHRVRFDAVQMPLNPFDAGFRSFETNVLPVVKQKGMAALGMKSLGGSGEAVMQGAITVEEALRYAMTLPVATTISGIDSLAVLRQNLNIARGFQPMSSDEMTALRSRCSGDAADGHLELYKTTKKYDAAVGREQHHYPTLEELPL